MKTQNFYLLSALVAILALNPTINLKAESPIKSRKDSAQEAVSITPDTVVAKVNGKSIKIGDILQEYADVLLKLDPKTLSKVFPKLREAAIHSQIFLEAAKKAKIENDKDVQEQIKQATNMVIIKAYIEKKVKDQSSEPALEARYKKFVDNYKPEREVRARHILVKQEDQALDVIKQLDSGADFEELAKKYSIDYNSEKGGDLGYFKRGSLVESVTEVAFSMEKGTFTKKPVKSQFGYHIIKKEDERDTKMPSYEEHRQALMSEITRETMEKAIAQLSANAKIERFDLSGKVDNNPVDLKEGLIDKDPIAAQ